ncbi:MAG: peptide deformylase [Rhodospirillales bacterium]|nr:peptide deformylase [Alphaproteobacteria bacterium]MCB9986680.1 peptide deformylase [Rhodospirillales bacterium]USO06794.1 MAG: peptide deformylase [Rhodospirillales bacterium]
METFQIIEIPDPVLRQTAQPVARVDDALRNQMHKMVETMYAAEGIGLAANQVGLLNRVIVVDTARRETNTPKPVAMANPEIVWHSEELWTCKEGCLSIPGQYADVERPRVVRVRYLDIDGNQAEIEAQNLASSCLQHEIDHLDGKLFIDYLTRLKRDLLLKRLDKDRKNAGEVL